MSEFEINGVLYKAGKLHVRKQLHVAKRLAPLMINVAPVALSLDKGKVPPLDVLVQAIVPAVQALSGLTDADLDHVVDACLDVCKTKRDNMWHKLWNAQAQAPQYDDGSLTMFAILRIVFEVIKESDLLNFSQGTFPSMPEPVKLQA